MPRYIITRNTPGIKLDALDAAGRTSNRVLAEMGTVKWIRSYVSEADGKIYCEYDAPNETAVREHAQRAGLPVDHIAEVSLEINPAMFM